MRLPMYEVRGTTVAADAAYVRSTKYDVRFEEFGGYAAGLAPMYDFRCTTRTTAYVRSTVYDVRFEL